MYLIDLININLNHTIIQIWLAYIINLSNQYVSSASTSFF